MPISMSDTEKRGQEHGPDQSLPRSAKKKVPKGVMSRLKIDPLEQAEEEEGEKRKR